MTKVGGRQIEFTVRATEAAKEIGAGSHYRVVIDMDRFMRRLEGATVSPVSTTIGAADKVRP